MDFGWEAIPAGRELHLTVVALLFISEETIWCLGIIGILPPLTGLSHQPALPSPTHTHTRLIHAGTL